MKKIYDLTKGVNENEFFYCYGPAVKAYNKFFVEDGNCIRNDFNPELGDFDYTSFISREKYGVGAKIYTQFKFEKRGAPLVVFGDDIRENAAGVPVYGTHFEVIGFEDGCNVWYLIPPPRPSRTPRRTRFDRQTAFPDPEYERGKTDGRDRGKGICDRDQRRKTDGDAPCDPRRNARRLNGLRRNQPFLRLRDRNLNLPPKKNPCGSPARIFLQF